jgi:hypothetical protein
MDRVLRIGLVGVALVAMLGGCGAGGSTSSSAGRRTVEESGLPPTPTPTKIAVAHRVGPQRVEHGEPTEVLSAKPCVNGPENGTTIMPLGPELGSCSQVPPSGRLGAVNTTADPIQVRIGDYRMLLRPGQTGMIPAPVRTYLGNGGHAVRSAGGSWRTIWVLIPGCELRWPAKPGEELCFPKWLRHRARAAAQWQREHPHQRSNALVAE